MYWWFKNDLWHIINQHSVGSTACSTPKANGHWCNVCIYRRTKPLVYFFTIKLTRPSKVYWGPFTTLFSYFIWWLQILHHVFKYYWLNYPSMITVKWLGLLTTGLWATMLHYYKVQHTTNGTLLQWDRVHNGKKQQCVVLWRTVVQRDENNVKRSLSVWFTRLEQLQAEQQEGIGSSRHGHAWKTCFEAMGLQSIF